MAYHQFTQNERVALMYLSQVGLSYREIGRRLKRSHSTIVRELKRNGRAFGTYCCDAAHNQAEARKKKPRHHIKQSNKPLCDYVENKLQEDWSPETIAGRLQIDFPRNSTMRISPETVYQWVFNNAQQGGD